MRIYRIEHTNGDGPMGTGAAEFFVRYYRDAVREGREPPRRPSGIDPEDIKDIIPATGLQPDHVFGCDSLEALRFWFWSPAGCEGLENTGCTLCAYEADGAVIVKAKTQVIFNRADATFLWNVPADMLHTLTDEEAMAMPRRDRIFLIPVIPEWMCRPRSFETGLPL